MGIKTVKHQFGNNRARYKLGVGDVDVDVGGEAGGVAIGGAIFLW